MLSDGMQLMPEPLIRKQKCAGRKNPCSAHFFVSGRAWQLPLSADEVHFSAEAHQIFAGKAETLLRQILSPQPGESGNPADIRTFE